MFTRTSGECKITNNMYYFGEFTFWLLFLWVMLLEHSVQKENTIIRKLLQSS